MNRRHASRPARSPRCRGAKSNCRSSQSEPAASSHGCASATTGKGWPAQASAGTAAPGVVVQATSWVCAAAGVKGDPCSLGGADLGSGAAFVPFGAAASAACPAGRVSVCCTHARAPSPSSGRQVTPSASAQTRWQDDGPSTPLSWKCPRAGEPGGLGAKQGTTRSISRPAASTACSASSSLARFITATAQWRPGLASGGRAKCRSCGSSSSASSSAPASAALRRPPGTLGRSVETQLRAWGGQASTKASARGHSAGGVSPWLVICRPSADNTHFHGACPSRLMPAASPDSPAGAPGSGCGVRTTRTDMEVGSCQ